MRPVSSRRRSTYARRLSRPFDACDGVVARRRAGQAGDQRGLGEVELGGLLAEVHIRGGADAVRALTQKDPVQIKRQDLLLAELAFQPQREKDLLEFASQRTLGGEHGVARQLHRDRAAAFADAARGDVAQERPYETLPVDTGMAVEPRILRREERVHDHLRDLLVSERNPALLTELRDELVVARAHLQRQLHAYLAQLRRGGNLRAQVLQRARKGEHQRGGGDQRSREQDHEHAWEARSHREFWDSVLVAFPGLCA